MSAPLDLITPENVSKDLIRSIFDAAYLETSLDSDGDIRVKDGISCWVLPSESKDRIKLLALFGFEDGVALDRKLECVNNISREYIIVKAFVNKNGGLVFDYDIYIEGGITKKNLVLTTKRFLKVPLQAVAEFGQDIVK